MPFPVATSNLTTKCVETCHPHTQKLSFTERPRFDVCSHEKYVCFSLPVHRKLYAHLNAECGSTSLRNSSNSKKICTEWYTIFSSCGKVIFGWQEFVLCSVVACKAINSSIFSSFTVLPTEIFISKQGELSTEWYFWKGNNRNLRTLEIFRAISLVSSQERKH